MVSERSECGKLVDSVKVQKQLEAQERVLDRYYKREQCLKDIGRIVIDLFNAAEQYRGIQ